MYFLKYLETVKCFYAYGVQDVIFISPLRIYKALFLELGWSGFGWIKPFLSFTSWNIFFCVYKSSWVLISKTFDLLQIYILEM